MKHITKASFLILFSALTLSSCVSSKRYAVAKAKAEEERKENAALNHRLNRLEDTVSYLHNRLGALGNANEYTNQQLNKTNSELFRTSSELNMTKEQIEAQRLRMQQLQSFIDQQQKVVSSLKSKIADALIGFNSSELTVSIRNGKVYISMEEALLFPSGSAAVNPRGKEALSKVATVVNANPDVNIEIEGHTDSKPIHTTIYPDNWALSTARATSIARVLIDEYAVTPVRLIAAGRSYYVPVATNETPEGRAQNRRTEIILEPKLDELMQLMNGAVNTAAK